jgi:predicted TIM-barrel fold metal-dependent hydrolase/ketosteroid isomerase-like protein
MTTTAQSRRETLLKEMFATLDRGDVPAYLEYLSEDAALRFGNNPPVVGRAAIKESLDGFYETFQSVRHDHVATWRRPEGAAVEADVTYVRLDGSDARAHAVTICRFNDRDEITDYRIFVDLAPLFAASGDAPVRARVCPDALSPAPPSATHYAQNVQATRREEAAMPEPRIDLHQHFFPGAGFGAEHLRHLEEDTGWRFPAENFPWSPEKNLAFMDRLGIGTAILSLTGSPGGDGAGAANREFARALNETAHRAVVDHPGRFGFFANLPIPSDTEGALGELAYALDVLGADGVNLTSSYGKGEDARYVGHDAFDPVWEELDRRRAVVFLHGDQTPGSNRFPNRLVPIPVGEVPNETYKAAADLVTRGKKRRYANVRIVLSHSGGSTPFLASRAAGLAHLQRAELSREEMLEDFAGFYYETALSGFETNLVALESLVAPDHILFGSDFPAVDVATAAWYTGNVDAYFADRPDRLGAVMRENALALFPRLRT